MAEASLMNKILRTSGVSVACGIGLLVSFFASLQGLGDPPMPEPGAIHLPLDFLQLPGLLGLIFIPVFWTRWVIRLWRNPTFLPETRPVFCFSCGHHSSYETWCNRCGTSFPPASPEATGSQSVRE